MTILKSSDYPKFRPIPRLHRKVVLTEKINGTNGLIEVTKVDEPDLFQATDPTGILAGGSDGNTYLVRAGNRNRWLTLEADNFGFAKWVYDNADALTALGEGKHYGEWFGKGIQSGYGLDERRFALFDVNRWYDLRYGLGEDYYARTFPKAQRVPDAVTVVPVVLITEGVLLNVAVDKALHTLESQGSLIAPGFQNPEGVVVYHDAARTYFKVTLKNDEQPKSKVSAK